MRRTLIGPMLALTALATGALGCSGGSGDDDPKGSGPGVETANDPGRVTMHRLNRVEYNIQSGICSARI